MTEIYKACILRTSGLALENIKAYPKSRRAPIEARRFSFPSDLKRDPKECFAESRKQHFSFTKM
ncbi:hypothetical protein LBK6_01065 [Leptospira borgpetersenii serovar Hardjo]|nr:hypothetical protein LBK6_01065 [Leptospira borgpetersenii serovar Hardjo]AWV68959.1 hypothetical protein B9T54_01180 [Leptospira borgpetersenii serovar Hardjo-bovis]TQE54125.1 hypothetical protein FFZ95_04780 [Leptospira borgpetersenii]AMX60266.1 hypothetical protein LBK9_01065 [Leptospira borgpetersenii serovar Hardjo]AMX63513.1 hypothetical protein LBK30_01080 [Leptospira borgpetersenii serovar Hardjo]